jgi:hypothetical protein
VDTPCEDSEPSMIPMSENAKGKQRAIEDSPSRMEVEDPLLRPPSPFIFSSVQEIETPHPRTTTPCPPTSTPWIHIAVNFPSAQFTVGRVLHQLISILQSPILRGSIQACGGLATLSETMKDFYLRVDDPTERESLAEVIRTVKLSLFRQLVVTSPCNPPDHLSTLPLHELVDLLEALPPTFSDPPAVDTTAQPTRSLIDLPRSSQVTSVSRTPISIPHTPAPPSPRTSLLDRMTPNTYERVRAIIRIRQKAFSRWTVAMRRLSDLPPQQRYNKREDIARAFKEKRQYWADIIIRFGGSVQEAWGGVPEILREFV